MPRTRRPRFGNPCVDAGVEQSETVKADPCVDAGVEQSETVKAELVDKEL